MRIAVQHALVATLAFLAFACAPCHRHPGPGHGGMMMGCGPGTCRYASKCFSEGAARSNDGVCQSCTGGKWVPATGCREVAAHDCCGMGKSAPCEHERPHRPRKH